MSNMELSLIAATGGTSAAVAIGTSSAQSAVINAGEVTVHCTVACFFRQGANPTAVSDGTDQYLAADRTYRIGMSPGNKLAFKTASGSGTVYLTPKA